MTLLHKKIKCNFKSSETLFWNGDFCNSNLIKLVFKLVSSWRLWKVIKANFYPEKETYFQKDVRHIQKIFNSIISNFFRPEAL